MTNEQTNDSFIFRLPVYTIITRDTRAVLMLSNGEQACPHLFTDDDLVRSYLSELRCVSQVPVSLSDRKSLTAFLQSAIKRSTHILMDSLARNGRPFRAERVPISGMLLALGVSAEPPSIGAPLEAEWVLPESFFGLPE